MATSPLIEDLTRWGDRFGLSRYVLANADSVVGVAEPTPRGMLRYLDWFADAGLLSGDVVTVFNASGTILASQAFGASPAQRRPSGGGWTRSSRFTGHRTRFPP